jgi:hypothetical protein
MLATVALIGGGHTIYQAVGHLFAHMYAVVIALLWGTAIYSRKRNVSQRSG